MKKILAAFGVLCIPFHFSFAQSSETFWPTLELGYGWTLADKGRYRFVDDSDKSYMSIFHFKLRYYATDALSLGVGIGATPYRSYSITSVLASAGLQYDVIRIPRLFAYADVGLPLSVETSSSDFLSSWLTDYEVSYTFGLCGQRRRWLQGSVGCAPIAVRCPWVSPVPVQRVRSLLKRPPARSAGRQARQARHPFEGWLYV